MAKKPLCCILSFLLLALPLFAQNNEPVISEAQAMLQETAQTPAPQDSSAMQTAYGDDLSPQQKFEENPKHNVHEYNYKQQVIVGSVVMFCVALAMVANNNYNPKR